MATTLFTEVTYRLSSLLEYTNVGDISLPEIQRPFVCPNAKVRDLFDSMYRGLTGYPVLRSSSGSPRQAIEKRPAGG